MSKRNVKWAAFFLLIVVVFGTIVRLRYPPLQGWSQAVQPFKGYEQADARLIKTFLTEESEPPATRYKALFQYLTLGFVKYRSANGALVYYPGAGSSHGVKVDALEGFARFFPLAAAWLSSGYDNLIEIDGERLDLIQLLHEGLVAGTDRQNSEYWGTIENHDQRIVEAADVALGLWIARESVWPTFSNQEKTQIATWLEQVIDRKVAKNNWLLFPVITLKSLQGLGINNPTYNPVIAKQYQRYKQNYLSEGWFNDPPKGIDYYNAWAVHYSLFWLDQIDPKFDPDFIRTTHAEFLKFYKYLFGKNGFPIMGRSVCYRIAAPAPLVTGTLLAPEVVSPGLAYRALDLTWRFFVERGALQSGTITQGYCGQNLSVLDKYSGAGSCLWSLRSLVAAFYVDRFVPFWQPSAERLPIEISDFSVASKASGWLVKGNASTQEIELNLLKKQGNRPSKIEEYGSLNRLVEFFFQRPFRPENSRALYHRPSYSTASPVVACKAHPLIAQEKTQ
ncbi:DUF2264 domain-containing protein [Leptolyngbya sp. FACHB-261]|uniref:DUF2264 domain-containing protein n=1 Tax=Leptolyngbya sp. FACHB-261 TaxID=2692806 RepID=UPI001689A1BA|nr:DUF2264 domain-containing protein [Leptolyngbya sp. FACHB-261]MBD2103051.1 DUF2264 domain-containing protein [Leptolyngbya sp. FACHB-261]